MTELTEGPYDWDDLAADERPEGYIDLGSLLMPNFEGWELRLQVDESSGTVLSAMLVDEEGMVEVRPFAAPRNGDLWGEVRPQLVAAATEQGGQTGEHEGPFGTELVCAVPVQMPDGNTGTQQSRIVGVNGPRWFLRATFLGRPAHDVEAGQTWNQLIAHMVVRRGSDPVPPGEALVLTMPPGARPQV